MTTTTVSAAMLVTQRLTTKSGETFQVSKSLRTLLVEDNEDDALLVQRELKRGGFDIICRRVETAKGMEEALREPWDLVISDYVMPQFNGFAA